MGIVLGRSIIFTFTFLIISNLGGLSKSTLMKLAGLIFLLLKRYIEKQNNITNLISRD